MKAKGTNYEISYEGKNSRKKTFSFGNFEKLFAANTK